MSVTIGKTIFVGSYWKKHFFCEDDEFLDEGWVWKIEGLRGFKLKTVTLVSEAFIAKGYGYKPGSNEKRGWCSPIPAPLFKRWYTKVKDPEYGTMNTVIIAGRSGLPGVWGWREEEDPKKDLGSDRFKPKKETL